MEPIGIPEVLDPERVLTDDREELTGDEHRARAQQLDAALRESCAYGTQLWHELDGMRKYLWTSAPDDPRLPGPTRTSATPTGPDDERGWTAWIDAVAATTSALAGAHGDSGYGLGEARHAAELRRSAPVARLYADHPDVAAREATDQSGPEPQRADVTGRPEHPDAASAARARTLRIAGTVALVMLAIRGVLPRRPRSAPST
jgi:hypothetical protein